MPRPAPLFSSLNTLNTDDNTRCAILRLLQDMLHRLGRQPSNNRVLLGLCKRILDENQSMHIDPLQGLQPPTLKFKACTTHQEPQMPNLNTTSASSWIQVSVSCTRKQRHADLAAQHVTLVPATTGTLQRLV